MSDPLAILPPETALHILSFLDPFSLTRCSRVAKCECPILYITSEILLVLTIFSAWNALVQVDQLWRSVALRLGYCPEPSARRFIAVTGTLQLCEHPQGSVQAQFQERLFEETLAVHRDRNVTSYFDDCHTFRKLSCKLWQLDCHWLGRVPYSPLQSPLASQQSLTLKPAQRRSNPRERLLSDLWRFKLDPIDNTVITTGIMGGIRVVDRATQALLWEIPRNQTREYPHLEFSNGWMVFDRIGFGHFEIWRNERLIPQDELGRPPQRGHFQQYTILSSPRSVRAYRFQYPTLAAASTDGAVVFWNVPTKEVVQTIDISSSPHRDGNITYIDFDDEYIFIVGVGAKTVTVFSRETGHIAWNLGDHFESGRPGPVTWRPDTNPVDTEAPFLRRTLTKSTPAPWQKAPNRMNMAQMTMRPYQIWSAIHPDFKTNTLLFLGQATVVLIRDYKKYFRDTSQPPDLFAELEFQDVRRSFGNSVSVPENNEDWNTQTVWDHAPDAQLTTHDGKAFLVNGKPMIIDLERSGPKQLLLQSTAQALSDGGPDESPPFTFYDNPQPFNRSHPGMMPTREIRPFHHCSCVQMDQVSVSIPFKS